MAFLNPAKCSARFCLHKGMPLNLSGSTCNRPASVGGYTQFHPVDTGLVLSGDTPGCSSASPATGSGTDNGLSTTSAAGSGKVAKAGSA
eukprot:6350608-Amphidinium_carterae.1